MCELCIEHRLLNGSGSLFWDLAHHMYARALCGKIAVVTDRPKEMLSYYPQAMDANLSASSERTVEHV